MAVDLAALRAELRNDPVGIGYASHLPDVDGEATRLINAPTRSFVQARFITARTVLSELVDGAAILTALEGVASSQTAVRYALDFLRQDSGIDVSSAATVGMLDMFAQAGVLTAAQVAAVKGMAVQAGSRAQELGFGAVSHADVMRAQVNDDGSSIT